MKSILEEGSSVLKAIQKAWENSGRPQEFTIKIVEFGKKNFLGVTTKPAIVSITYDITKQTERYKEKIITRPKKKQKIVRQEERVFRRDDHATKRAGGWNKELIDCSIGWLSQILHILKVKANISYKVDQRILNIYIDQKFLAETEDEKMFFISLSHLLMQFLKRKYKKRFANYYLIMHTKQS